MVVFLLTEELYSFYWFYINMFFQLIVFSYLPSKDRFSTKHPFLFHSETGEIIRELNVFLFHTSAYSLAESIRNIKARNKVSHFTQVSLLRQKADWSRGSVDLEDKKRLGTMIKSGVGFVKL